MLTRSSKLMDGGSTCEALECIREELTALAGQRVGFEEVDMSSFMYDDLGYFDLEQRTSQPLDNPFDPRVSLRS